MNQKMGQWLLSAVFALSLCIYAPHGFQRMYFNFAFMDALKYGTRLAQASTFTAPAEIVYTSPNRRWLNLWYQGTLWVDGPMAAEVGRLTWLQGYSAQTIVTYLERAVAYDAPTPITYWRLGDAYWRAGNEPAAIEAWRKGNAASYFQQRGLALWRRGQRREAEQALQRAVAIAPTHPNLLQQMGQFYWEQGERLLARHYWQRAREVETRPEAQLILDGQIAQAEGELQAAITFFKAALTRRPSDAELYWQLAVAQREHAQFAEALETLRLGIRRVANPFGLYLRLGQWLMAAEQWRDAEQAYQHAATLDRRNAEVWLSRAWNALAQEKWAEAEQYLQSASALKPDDAETHWALSILAAQQGRCIEARASYARATALEPTIELRRSPVHYNARPCCLSQR